jgi:hypothetical protein
MIGTERKIRHTETSRYRSSRYRGFTILQTLLLALQYFNTRVTDVRIIDVLFSGIHRILQWGGGLKNK